MSRVLLVLAAVGLAVYALVDMSSSDTRRRGGLPKGLWVILIVFLPYVGGIAWLVTRWNNRTATPGANRLRRSQPGPVAPDDDPDFLWRLEQQRRRGRSEPPPPGGSPTG